MSTSLLTKKRFLPYFCTQFLGAFNDNVFKNALLIFVTYHLVSQHSALLVNVAAGIFILPFFLFSSIAGQWADKYEKAAMIRKIKLAEIAIMLFACFTLYLQSVPLMLLTLFLLGSQSAFFGPIKYSILPQHLRKSELLNGNALVESATFIAILLGTLAGGLLASKLEYVPVLQLSLLAIALLGWFSSRQIPSAAATQPTLDVSYNIIKSSLSIIRSARKNRPVFLSIVAISWFWFFGTIMLTQFPTFTRSVLSGDAQVATLLLALFSIGIALGSMACSFLSGKHVEIGLMPIGAMGIGFFAWQLGSYNLPATDELLSITQLLQLEGIWSILFTLLMIAFFSGLFIVPLYAFVQMRSDESQRARMFAATNIINSLFMVVASVFAILCLSFGLSVSDLFKVVAVMNLIVTVYILTVIPEFVLRLLGWLLIHSIYRIKKEDLHHIPDSGSAVLVCNHVSFVDPIIINAVVNRPVRFVMIENIYRMPVANWFFRTLKTIPIAPSKENPTIVQQAYDQIAEALQRGELVCLFPEGAITYDGELDTFKPGVERIIERTPVDVIPMAISGLWGTWFSRFRGRAMRGFPSQFMKQLTIVSGEPVTADRVSCKLLFERVAALRGEQR